MERRRRADGFVPCGEMSTEGDQRMLRETDKRMEERQVASRLIRLYAQLSTGHYAPEARPRPVRGRGRGLGSLFRQAEFFSYLFDGDSFSIFGFLRALVEEFHQFLVLRRGFHFFGEVVAFADVKGEPVVAREVVFWFHVGDVGALLAGFTRLRRTGVTDLAL